MFERLVTLSLALRAAWDSLAYLFDSSGQPCGECRCCLNSDSAFGPSAVL